MGLSVNLGLEIWELTLKSLNPIIRSSLMDISLLTPDKQVKLQYWIDVIRQCRASGMTNQDWCEQHGISLKSYYYWLAKIRKLAVEDLPRKNCGIRAAQSPQVPVTEASGFTEISFPTSTSSHTEPTAVLHIGNISVELFERTSSEQVVSILKAVQSC